MAANLTSRPLPSYGRPGRVVECFNAAVTYWLVVEIESATATRFELWRGECDLDGGGRSSIPSPCLPTRLIRRFQNHSPMIRSYIAESIETHRRVENVTVEPDSRPAPVQIIDEVVMAKTAVLVRAIRETFDDLAGLVGPDAGASKTRAAVQSALKQVLGGKSLEPVSAPVVVSSRSPTARGPKPGGRQLKMHVGAKAFDSMDGATKDRARAAITAVGSGWGKLSKAARDRVLAPHLGR